MNTLSLVTIAIEIESLIKIINKWQDAGTKFVPAPLVERVLARPFLTGVLRRGELELSRLAEGGEASAVQNSERSIKIMDCSPLYA